MLLQKRPILIGGLGLSASLWLLETLDFNIFDGSTLLSAIALGSGIWWWRHRDRPTVSVPPSPPERPDRSAVEAALEVVRQRISDLSQEIQTHLPSERHPEWQERLQAFRDQISTLLSALDRTQLEWAVTGEKRTGKSQMIEQLRSPAVTATVDLSPLTLTEVSLATIADSPDAWDTFDGLLFVTDEDLTESAFSIIQQRVMAGQRVVVVFNKQDQYAPDNRASIQQQLRLRVAGLPETVQLAPISARPNPVTVRRHQADGAVEEFTETVDPDLTALTRQLSQILANETQDLVLATTLRQTQALRRSVQQGLNSLRRERAMPVVEQLQWIAAATAFANPVPSLDVLATVAINGQLIMDLGNLYGLKFSLEEAKTAASTLASLTVKLGLVELSTQALTAALKTHPATYAAGGAIQGLSAAYLTRMAGLSLIECFEAATLEDRATKTLPWEAVGERLQTLLQSSRQGAFLQTLIQQGWERFRNQPAASASPAPVFLPEGTQPALKMPLTQPVPDPVPESVSAQNAASVSSSQPMP